MPSTVPPPFLFRYSFPVQRRDDLPGRSALLKLPAECRLAFPSRLSSQTAFADVRLAWNARGLGVSVQVSGKSVPPSGFAARPEEADALQLWIDTRNTLNIHRASRFCHYFCLLPAAGERGEDGSVAVPVPIPRAREEPPRPDPGLIRVSASVSSRSWLLEAWLPAEALHGFDPEASPRLGFYCCVRDRELGEQYLTVGRDFPFTSDPSLWSTLELVSS